MQRMRTPLLGMVCAIVLTVAFLKGVIHATTPDLGTLMQADPAGFGPIANR